MQLDSSCCAVLKGCISHHISTCNLEWRLDRRSESHETNPKSSGICRAWFHIPAVCVSVSLQYKWNENIKVTELTKQFIKSNGFFLHRCWACLRFTVKFPQSVKLSLLLGWLKHFFSFFFFFKLATATNSLQGVLLVFFNVSHLYCRKAEFTGFV